jgi:hypothetical protein
MEQELHCHESQVWHLPTEHSKSRNMKPTIQSVTDAPCGCGYLDAARAGRADPLRYDPSSDEYHITVPTEHGAHITVRILHCPICGGVGGPSRRADFFETVAEEELIRIEQLVRGIESADNLVAAFGEPDYAESLESLNATTKAVAFPSSADDFPRRVWTYYGISKTADVQFTFYQSGKLDHVVYPKGRERTTSSK